MPRLNIDVDFLKRYATLSKPLQTAVDRAIKKFPEQYFASQHLEKLAGARDDKLRTIRITDGYRGIVLALPGGDYVLKDVLDHDHANREAVKKRFTVNQVLGVAEDRDQDAIDTLQPVIAQQARATEQRLFDQVKDSTLTRLGVDPELVPLVRLLVTEVHLDLLEKLIPTLQHRTLVGLASGMSEEEVWDELSTYLVEVPETVDPEDFDAAIARTPDRYVTVTGPDELMEILAKPFALWRNFLHPTQHDLAYRSYRGPVLVSGGAGTGKTVVAVHHAAHLARRYAGQDGPAPILLTTFTRNLAVALTAQVDLLVTEPAGRSRIEVCGVDRLAHRIVAKDSGQQPGIVSPASLSGYFQLAADAEGGKVGPGFARREWEQVVLGHRVRDLADYLACDRRGRGRLPRGVTREDIWAVIARVEARLRDDRLQTHEQVADQAALLLASSGQRPYRHVIVDEGQDLHPARWRLLRAAVASGPDDMFLAADANQRIYDNRVSLESLGIRVRGRGRRLTISYRTTQEILSWAVRVLDPAATDGLDETSDRLDGYRSMTHGPRPVVRGYPDRNAEHGGLAEQLGQWRDRGVEPGAIAVAARTSALAEAARAALRQAGIMVTSATEGAEGGVVVDTLHRMKGMEFRCVAVICSDDNQLPLPMALADPDEDPTAHQQDLRRERCLLFVACTRARDALYVSHLAGAPSPFLPSPR